MKAAHNLVPNMVNELKQARSNPFWIHEVSSYVQNALWWRYREHFEGIVRVDFLIGHLYYQGAWSDKRFDFELF